MIVDTSVWIDHLRHGEPGLFDVVERDDVEVHSFVLGELVLGRVPGDLVRWLKMLRPAPSATDGEVMAMVEAHGLAGSGIGWVDAHLLASALVSGSSLLTHDRRLAAVAAGLDIAASV